MAEAATGPKAQQVGKPQRVPKVLFTLDGAEHDIDEPLVYADDLGMLRGDGVFETVLVRGGSPRRLDAHLERLRSSAKALDLPRPDVDAWRKVAVAAGSRWGTSRDGMMRLVLSRGREGGGGHTGYVTVCPVGPGVEKVRREGVAALTLERGYSVDLASAAPWQLLGAKTLSYAANMAAVRYAQQHGADDVIFISAEGNVLEGTRSTVVARLDGMLVTPPVEHGILPGTTQQGLFDVARERGIDCEYRALRTGDLIAAEGIWLLSSVTLAARVHTLNGFALPDSDFDEDLRDMINTALKDVSAG